MLFQVTICLLLCQAFSSSSSAIEQPSQSGNTLQLRNSPEEISPVFNEIAPENGPEYVEEVSYKPVTLEAASKVTPKQAQCLKIGTGSQLKSISRASLRAPLSNSNHLDTLKVVCRSQQKPEMWIAQNKYQLFDNRQKVQSLTFEDTDTAIVVLDAKLGTLSFELPGCNVCVKKNEAGSNNLNVFVASSTTNDDEKLADGRVTNSNVPELFNREKKLRVKRAVNSNSVQVSLSSAKKNVGEGLTVTCSAQSKNITWKDPQGKEVKSIVTSDPRVKESFTNAQNKSELIFRSISVGVGGKYTCTANSNGRLETEAFNLTVIAPVVQPKAKLTPSKSKVSLEEGSDYAVECSGNSNNITWKHPQNHVFPTYAGGAGTSYFYVQPANFDNKTMLYFKNVSASFGGDYSCSVNSSGLQDVAKLTLSISKPGLTISPDKNTFSEKENTDLDISCEGPMKTISWYYNNNEISTNKNFDVFQKSPDMEGGVMKRKLKFDDLQTTNSGKYTCVGFSTFNGARIERTITLSVRETDILNYPKLTVNDDKVADTNLYYRVNETLEVVCKGDTEFIAWKGPPNSWNIPETTSPTNNRIDAERTKKKKIALKFKSITTSDEGTYICEVTKKKNTKSKSFKLYVIDPVRITGFPQSPTTREGGYVTLGCLTTGHPKAILNWYFNEVHSDGTSHSKLIDGQTNSHFKLDGDNLLVSNITYREAGRYMCEAIQDIEKGSTDRRTMDINVEHKPYPSRNRTIYEKKLHTYVEVPCKMVANPEPMYTWFQNVNGTFQMISPPSPDRLLKMNFNQESQFGEYKCQANNIIGYNEQHILLIPMENPRPPRIELDTVTKQFAQLKAFAVRNSSFIFYNIEYKEKDTRDWTGMNVTLGETWDTKYEIPGLFEKTSYIIRVRSINELGVSEPSNEIEFTTGSGIRLTASFIVLFAILLRWIF
ncbi:hemicentin-1-like [Planococcus citri]|uniref:hemicentin-1-like n=1 Tax=Planococcus citri TaxID=170843 RepID=UPI0031F89D55